MNKKLEQVLKNGKDLAKEFIEFNKDCLSPYNAVGKMEKMLQKHKFIELKEKQEWKLKSGEFYYLKRGGYSSLVAFSIPSKFQAQDSYFKMIGTHTDSPCIRLAPKFDHKSNGFEQVCLQMYGGGLWHTWYDRSLLLGGRIIIKNDEGKLQTLLYQSKKPLAKIPTLAIHLKNPKTLEIKKEKDLKPIIATTLLRQLNCGENGECSMLLEFLAKEISVKSEQIKDFDLCFAGSEDPHLFGLYDEFISSPRLDNLYSAFSSIKSLIDCKNQGEKKDTNDVQLIAMFDHEEIGSNTYVGADSEYLRSVLYRITQNLGVEKEKEFQRIMRRSMFLSCDMAHSVHPNFPEFHQPNHKPKINHGIVLKRNANGRYTTDALSGSVIKLIAEKNDVPLIDFIVPCDSRCGSTIGPMTASILGCLAVDIGAPQLGMHSISETGGVLDFTYYTNLMQGFLQQNLAELQIED